MIIGLCGFKRSGKSTVASMLITEYEFVPLSMATPLKNMLTVYLEGMGVPSNEIYDMLYGNKKEEPHQALGGETPRHAMQTLGTEWGRVLIHPDIWVNAWTAAAKKRAPFYRIVADDVRHSNEVTAIKNLGGVVIRVNRAAISSTDKHSSEQEIMSLSTEVGIYNNGTIEQLQDVVRLVIKELMLTRSNNVLEIKPNNNNNPTTEK